MKMQVKAIAAAIAFAVAGSANAAIDYGNGHSGEMFLSVYDATAQLSYTHDLGIDVVTYRDAHNGIDVAADSNLQSFIANAAGPLTWNIGGISVQTVHTLADFDNQGILTTTTDLSSVHSSQSGLTSAYAKGQAYVQGVNGLDGASNSDFSLNLSTSNIAPGDGGGYFDSVNWSTNWGGTVPFNTAADLGSSMTLVWDGLHYDAGYQNVVTNLGQITLMSDGHLVSAVPAPAAVWLFSLGMLGLVGVARRRKSA